MSAKAIAVKKYVVRLSVEERTHLETMIHTGKRSAQLLTKARILLKADASAAGPGWRDSEIARALDTSLDTIARTRRQDTAFSGARTALAVANIDAEVAEIARRGR